MKVRRGTAADVPRALEIWRAAVDTTHRFLTPEHRREIDAIVSGFLPQAELWLVDDGNRPVGFLVMDGRMIDALFVDPAVHGRGFGTALLAHALELAPATNSRPNSISSLRGSRPNSSRWARRIREAMSVPASRSSLATSAALRSRMKGLLRTNNCCSGEVVGVRAPACSTGSGKSFSRSITSNSCRWMRPYSVRRRWFASLKSSAGPPIRRSRFPATASIASRHGSKSSRRRFIRESSRFSGSDECGLRTADCRLEEVFDSAFRNPNSAICRYVADSMISRCSHLSDQPFSIKRAARSSSSSGCVGRAP